MPHILPVLGGSFAMAQNTMAHRAFPLRITSSVRGVCSRTGVSGLFERPRRVVQGSTRSRAGGVPIS
eukprot:3910477-Pyramimonas_sp.AAC.1